MTGDPVKVVHDPVVKGTESDCYVICHECGYEGLERPDEYTPGVLKLSTSRNNANNIARRHRKSVAA